MSEDDYSDDDEYEHSSIDDLESRINDLDSKTDDLESEINDLKSRIETSESNVQKIGEKVESMDRYISGCGMGVWYIGISLSVVISWGNNHSIFWAIIHGVLSWVYIIWEYRLIIWDWILSIIGLIAALAHK